MEKILSSEKKYRILAGVILSFLFLYCILDRSKNLVWIFLSFAITVFLIPRLLLMFERQKQRDGIYFSENGVYYYIDGELFEMIEWSSLLISEIPLGIKIKNSMLLKFESKIKLTKPFYFHLNWFNEDSCINLTKQFVPRENVLHELIIKYCQKRGIF